MSASREKKLRQDQVESGYVDPKTQMEREKQKAEKRISALYRVIAVAFVLVVLCVGIWRSNIISRSATAVTIDGEKYSAAEVNFYYQNVYRSFLSSNSYFISYLGLDTSASLKGQTVNATAASMLGVEEGSSWFDYMMDSAIQQMTLMEKVLKQAESEGFQYSAGVQAQYDDSMQALADTAAASGTSVSKYLQQNLGSNMTEKVYGQQLMKMFQYQEYINAYTEGLTYTDAELEDAYQADPKSYDKVSWEYVVVSGTAESTTDADGNAVDPTEEETAAALEAAQAAAEEILAACESGKSLETLAEGYEKATYYSSDATSYYDGTTGNWLFDDARKAGDTDILEVGSSRYVVLFHERYRNEEDTVNVRHILVMPESGTLTSTDEGYEAEVTTLKEAAHAKAEDILAQWKAGEATEDSFIQLAMETSEDSSKYTGGLISDIGPDSSLVEEFKTWCLDASRKAGDTAVVDSTYGSHVMYFSNTDLPAWASAVRTTLQTETSNQWAEELMEGTSAEQSSFGMKFVG